MRCSEGPGEVSWGFLFEVHEGLAVADEWGLDDARGERLVADEDLYGVAGLHREGNARESDRAPQRGREGAAGHFALAVIGLHFLVGAQHAAGIEEEQTHELPRLALRLERLAAGEVAFALHV